MCRTSGGTTETGPEIMLSRLRSFYADGKSLADMLTYYDLLDREIPPLVFNSQD